MKIRFLIFLLFSVIFLGCPSPTNEIPEDENPAENTPSEEQTTDAQYYLGGVLDGKNLEVSLTFPVSNGISRTAVEVPLSGFIVYDGMTFDCKGFIDSETNFFSISSKGVSNGTSYVFSGSGKLNNAVFSDLTIALSILVNSLLTETFECQLTQKTDEVKKTSVDCTDNSASTYGFEGIWTTSGSGTNSTGQGAEEITWSTEWIMKYIFSISSLTRFYQDDAVDDAYDIYNETDSQKVVYLTVEEVTTNEWVLVFVSYIEKPDIGNNDAVKYDISAWKLIKNSDSELQAGWLDIENDTYLTNFNPSNNDMLNAGEFKYYYENDDNTYTETTLTEIVNSVKTIGPSTPGTTGIIFKR